MNRYESKIAFNNPDEIADVFPMNKAKSENIAAIARITIIGLTPRWLRWNEFDIW